MIKAIGMVIGLGLLSALTVGAAEKTESAQKLQIISDLQLLDEIESVNQEDGSHVWLRSSDEEEETFNLYQKKRNSCENCYKPQ